jgi:hypothetical protein
MSWALGVDLGTSFSAAAVASGPRLETVPLGAHSSAVPSAVYQGNDDMVVGDSALLRGDAAPSRLSLGFKRQLGESTPLLVADRFVTAEELEARLGKWVFARACQLEGSTPSEVVFTFPAFWGAYRRDIFLRLAREVVEDPERVRILTEPEAAATYYASRDRLPAGAIVGVYDFGGGTFDASILQRAEDGFEVLGHPAGDDELGGMDIDAALLRFVLERADVPLNTLDQSNEVVAAAIARLRRNVTIAKELLSEDTSADIAVVVNSTATTVRVLRRELEEVMEPFIERTMNVFETAMNYASVGAADLHSVLLVGGASRAPRVGEALIDRFRAPLALDSHPKFAVCLGAAISSQHDVAVHRAGDVGSGSGSVGVTAGGGGAGSLPPPARPLPPPSGARSGGPRRARSRRTLVLIVAAAVLVIAIAGVSIFVATRGGGSSGSAADHYRDAVLRSSPAGYWRLDEHGGTQLADSSGHGAVGTIGGGVVQGQAGAMNGSVATAFDGSTGCAVVGPKTNPKTFSIEAWFNTTTQRGGAIVAFNESAGINPSIQNRDRHIYMRNDGLLTFGNDHAQGLATSPGAYNDGRWHQVVATVGPEGQRLYVDGALVASSSHSAVEPYDGYWHIGCSLFNGWPNPPTSGYLNGRIDDVSIFSTALSAATVADHYRAAQPA